MNANWDALAGVHLQLSSLQTSVRQGRVFTYLNMLDFQSNISCLWRSWGKDWLEGILWPLPNRLVQVVVPPGICVISIGLCKALPQGETPWWEELGRDIELHTVRHLHSSFWQVTS